MADPLHDIMKQMNEHGRIAVYDAIYGDVADEWPRGMLDR